MSSTKHSAFQWFSRAATIVLALCLLSSSTPAAPQTIVSVAKESSITFAFWMRANGFPGKLWRALSPQQGSSGQETQAQRDARVVSLRIYPGDVTIQLGQQVNFTAVPVDQNGVPVGGVRVKWGALRSVSIDPTGATSALGVGPAFSSTSTPTFRALTTGVFQVTATASGQSAQATIIVPQGLRPNLNETPIRTVQVSSRDLPSGLLTRLQTNSKNSQQRALSHGRENASAKRRPERRGAHASAENADVSSAVSTKMRGSAATAMPIIADDGWGSSNYWSSGDPRNGRGDPPGAPLDGGAGSGNFQVSAPVGSWPGRGINIALGLSGNTRLWNKAGSQINFDIDRDWPAPGWSLGFGKLLGMGVYNGGMLVDADGTRHSYTGTVTAYSWGTTFVGHTSDGSFIDYNYQSGTGGGIVWAQAKLANGTVITYGAAGPGAVYPTSILDANGNYITITYMNNAGPRIQTVTDTMGRVINFYYDANNLLTAINGPGLNGGVRTLVRLH